MYETFPLIPLPGFLAQIFVMRIFSPEICVSLAFGLLLIGLVFLGLGISDYRKWKNSYGLWNIKAGFKALGFSVAFLVAGQYVILALAIYAIAYLARLLIEGTKILINHPKQMDE